VRQAQFSAPSLQSKINISSIHLNIPAHLPPSPHLSINRASETTTTTVALRYLHPSVRLNLPTHLYDIGEKQTKHLPCPCASYVRMASHLQPPRSKAAAPDAYLINYLLPYQTNSPPYSTYSTTSLRNNHGTHLPIPHQAQAAEHSHSHSHSHFHKATLRKASE